MKHPSLFPVALVNVALRTLPVLLCAFAVLPAHARKLKVQVLVTPGVVVVQGQCPEMAGANPEAALTGTNTYSLVPYVEKNYPGSVTVSVTGGVPPYRYDWHGLMADASVCSVMPGMVRVTVSDAAGNSVTRSVHVGATTRLLPSPCGDFPLTEEENVQVTYAPARQRREVRPVQQVVSRGTVQGDYRNDVQRIPPGPAGGGRGTFKPVAVPAGRSTR